MSIERSNLALGIGQLVVALLLWLGISPSFFQNLIPTTQSSWILFFLIGGFAFSGYGLYRTFHPKTVNVRNIQSKVREWLDAFNFDHGVTPPWEPWYFGYRVTLPGGPLLFIARPKARKGEYLLLTGKITAIGWGDREAFKALTDAQRQSLFHQVRLETARAKFFFYSDASLDQISFDNWVPITNKLTAATFIENINQMYFSAQILWSTMSLHLGSKPSPTLPSSTPDTEAAPPSQA